MREFEGIFTKEKDTRKERETQLVEAQGECHGGRIWLADCERDRERQVATSN